MTGPTTTTPETTTELTPVKETPAQRVERIKREKAPWSIMDDIRRYSREGFSAISNEDLTVRFRAWGLYTQGDGGGTRGEEMPFFMMRVRTPNGFINSAMVRRIAEISDHKTGSREDPGPDHVRYDQRRRADQAKLPEKRAGSDCAGR